MRSLGSVSRLKKKNKKVPKSTVQKFEETEHCVTSFVDSRGILHNVRAQIKILATL